MLFLSEEKRNRIAKETMEIYAPLANRIGMHNVRDELEDLSFKVLNSEARTLILDRLENIFPNTQKLFSEISDEINLYLKKTKLKQQLLEGKSHV